MLRRSCEGREGAGLGCPLAQFGGPSWQLAARSLQYRVQQTVVCPCSHSVCLANRPPLHQACVAAAAEACTLPCRLLKLPKILLLSIPCCD